MRHVDLLLLGWSLSAVGAALAARSRGLSVAILGGVGAERGIHPFKWIGPTQLNAAPLAGEEFHDLAVTRLRALGVELWFGRYSDRDDLISVDARGVRYTSGLYETQGIKQGLLGSYALLTTSAATDELDEFPRIESGLGLSLCAWSDGVFYPPGPVIVYGDARFAVDQALWAARYGCRVVLICPSRQLSVPGWLSDHFARCRDSIEIVVDATIDEIVTTAAGRVSGVRIGDRRYQASAVFLARLSRSPWDELDSLPLVALRESPRVGFAGRLAGLDLQDDDRLLRDGARALRELLGPSS